MAEGFNALRENDAINAAARPNAVESEWEGILNYANATSQEIVNLLRQGQVVSSVAIENVLSLYDRAGNELYFATHTAYPSHDGTTDYRFNSREDTELYDTTIDTIRNLKKQSEEAIRGALALKGGGGAYGNAVALLSEQGFLDANLKDTSSFYGTMEGWLKRGDTDNGANLFFRVVNAANLLDSNGFKNSGYKGADFIIQRARDIKKQAGKLQEDAKQNYYGKNGFPLTGWGSAQSMIDSFMNDENVQALGGVAGWNFTPSESENARTRNFSSEAHGNALYKAGQLFYSARRAGVELLHPYMRENYYDWRNMDFRYIGDKETQAELSRLSKACDQFEGWYEQLKAILLDEGTRNADYETSALAAYYKHKPEWEPAEIVSQWTHIVGETEFDETVENATNYSRDVTGTGGLDEKVNEAANAGAAPNPFGEGSLGAGMVPGIDPYIGAGNYGGS